MNTASDQNILKEEENKLSFKPFGFLRALLGVRKFEIQEDVNLFKLGKDCSQCKRLIVHREAISVCRCYLFAHKDCLKNQLGRVNLSECSSIYCKSCKAQVHAFIDSDYFFKINVSIGDLIVLFICAVLCVASMVYLVNFKNVQRQEIRQKELETHTRHSAPTISMQEIIPMAVLFIFGSLFWFSLIGMIINKKTTIKDIAGTNIDINVSAFEQLQCKIREQSCHSIPLKKEINEL